MRRANQSTNPYFTSYWRESGFEVVFLFWFCDWGGCCCCCNWWMLCWVEEGCCNWNIWVLTESCGTMHFEGFSPLNSVVASFNRWTSVVKASFKAIPLCHKQQKSHQQPNVAQMVLSFGVNVVCWKLNNDMKCRWEQSMEHQKENWWYHMFSDAYPGYF